MRVLVPVDGSAAALAPIAHLAWLSRAGVKLDVRVLNVQPCFHLHIAQFIPRSARQAFRAERSAAAFSDALEALAAARIPCTALCELGQPAERIAAVAERERVDEIMIGVGRHPAWLRLLAPSVARQVMALTDIPVSVFPSVTARVIPPAAAERLE